MTLEVVPQVAPTVTPESPSKTVSFKTIHDIARLKSEDRHYADYSDETTIGLLLRVYRSGKKVYRYRYQLKGKTRILTIGDTREVKLQEARAIATSSRAKVLKGEDPAADEQRAKAEARNTPTIQEFVQEYLDRHAKLHKTEKSWKEDERMLIREVVPKIGRIRMDQVTKRDIVSVIDDIRDRNANTQANRVVAVVRKMFNFAVSRGVITYSPVNGISIHKEKSRNIVLSDEQIHYLWSVTEVPADDSQQSRHPSILRVLRVLLLLGLRIDEACSAHKSEIDLDNSVWVIPGEDCTNTTIRRTKNKFTHTVPLSPLALAIVKDSIAFADKIKSDWLFPGGIENGHITKDGVEHAMRALVGDGTGGKRPASKRGVASGPSPHDLRRTFATHIGSLGYNRLIQDKLLNHIDGSVGGIYDRYDYEKEKREALTAWETKLLEIIKTPEGTTTSSSLMTGVSVAA